MSYANIEVAQIAAISLSRCIGKDNELPWHISADLQHFKKMTTKPNDGAIQGVVVMGRKTFESMDSKPLPKRVSFIVTTQRDYAGQKGLEDRDDAYVVHSLDEALTQAASLAQDTNLDTIWIIGGERVFSDAFTYTDRVELTHVDIEITDGDAFYPELPSEFEISAESEQMYDEKSGLDFRFVTYVKKPAE